MWDRKIWNSQHRGCTGKQNSSAVCTKRNQKNTTLTIAKNWEHWTLKFDFKEENYNLPVWASRLVKKKKYPWLIKPTCKQRHSFLSYGEVSIWYGSKNNRNKFITSGCSRFQRVERRRTNCLPNEVLHKQKLCSIHFLSWKDDQMRLTCWHCLSTSSRIFFSQSRTIRLDSDMKISFSTSLYPFSLCASCFTTIRKFWGGIIASWGQTFLVHHIWPFFMKFFPGHLHRRGG